MNPCQGGTLSVMQNRLASAGLWGLGGLRERSVQAAVGNHNGFFA